jgi:hypothetical protein
VIHKVGYECSKGPVVEAVAIKIGKRRSCMAEVMDEECFKLLLAIVKAAGN